VRRRKKEVHDQSNKRRVSDIHTGDDRVLEEEVIVFGWLVDVLSLWVHPKWWFGDTDYKDCVVKTLSLAVPKQSSGSEVE
jgi:hypothetical protein